MSLTEHMHCKYSLFFGVPCHPLLLLFCLLLFIVLFPFIIPLLFSLRNPCLPYSDGDIFSIVSTRKCRLFTFQVKVCIHLERVSVHIARCCDVFAIWLLIGSSIYREDHCFPVWVCRGPAIPFHSLSVSGCTN